MRVERRWVFVGSVSDGAVDLNRVLVLHRTAVLDDSVVCILKMPLYVV